MNNKGALTIAAVLAAAYFNVPGGSLAGEHSADPPQVDAKSTVATATGGNQPESSTPQSSGSKSTVREKIQSLKAKILPERLKRDQEFKEASAKFPDFCKHWADNLREREHDNLSKLVFTLKEGVHTATYTGYSEVTTCEAHQSKDGFSIGRIIYEEFVYSLEGKTPEEAKHGEKKPISDTRTTEIFRWEKQKWFR